MYIGIFCVQFDFNASWQRRGCGVLYITALSLCLISFRQKRYRIFRSLLHFHSIFVFFTFNLHTFVCHADLLKSGTCSLFFFTSYASSSSSSYFCRAGIGFYRVACCHCLWCDILFVCVGRVCVCFGVFSLCSYFSWAFHNLFSVCSATKW